MARRPFFTGDYGSALGRIDTRPIMEAARAQGQMFAGLGAEAAKTIETYQLNKEERAKLTGEIEQDILNYGNSLTQTGNEDIDKKNQWSLMPLSKYGSHSLEAYGYRLGEYKGQFGKTTDWSEWSPEMEDYCAQDVQVTTKLCDHFHKYLSGSKWNTR